MNFTSTAHSTYLEHNGKENRGGLKYVPGQNAGLPAGSGMQKPGMRLSALVKPGAVNICGCYLLAMSAFLSPVALLFATRFAEPELQHHRAHYFYIRTTIALLVIGSCLGILMIVLGASLSTLLILAGLTVLFLTAILTLARCLSGLVRTFRGLPPRNYRSYLV